MSKLFLNEKKIGELLGMAETRPRDFALFHLAVSTGLRVSDLIRVRRIDVIDSDSNVVRTLRLKMKKTKIWIERPLREDCRQAVAKLLASREDGNPYLFIGRKDTRFKTRYSRPITRQTAHNIYRSYLERLYPYSILQGTSCHVTRRSVAKIISKKAGRIEPASQFLGHKSIATTMAYIDMSEFGKQADDIVDKLEW